MNFPTAYNSRKYFENVTICIGIGSYSYRKKENEIHSRCGCLRNTILTAEITSITVRSSFIRMENFRLAHFSACMCLCVSHLAFFYLILICCYSFFGGFTQKTYVNFGHTNKSNT